MMTPYDSALRIRRREVEDVRVSISVEVRRLSEVESALEGVARRTTAEIERASYDPTISSYAFLSRMRSERTRLDTDKRAIGQQLDRLRAHAAEAYGSLKAIENAADQYRDEVSRNAAAAEQGRSDDFAATAFLRARRPRPGRSRS